MTLEDAVDDLYGVAPSEFVARRKALVEQAREKHDRALAAAIGKLRKPTQVAWAINIWARREPDAVADLAALAADLAAAQRRSSPARIREVSERRSEVVESSVLGVARVATEAGIPLSANAVREVTQTLRAALADEEVFADLRGGRLITSAEYSGFGPAGVFLGPELTVAGDEPQPERVVDDDDGHDETELAGAVESLREATTAKETAQEGARAADREVQSVSAQVDSLAERVDQLRAEAERVSDELRFARRHLDTAVEARRLARQELRDADAELLEARERVVELGGDA